jgi:hypothetical protein
MTQLAGAAISITQSGTQSGFAITGNNCSGSGTISLTGSLDVTSLIAHNPGLNPVGSGTQPSVPATTVAQVNPLPYDATVYLLNGTGTLTFKITGYSGNETSGTVPASAMVPIRVPAGASITLTYASGSPTWVWVYE